MSNTGKHLILVRDPNLNPLLTKYCIPCLTWNYNPFFHCTFFSILSRYTGVAGGERAPTFHHDWSADQSEGAAPLRPWRAEKDGRLTAGEAETTDGAGQAAAGAGTEGLSVLLML